MLRLLHRGHAHTHAHALAEAHAGPAAVTAALREAGFTDVAQSGHGRTASGAHTFHRATR